MRFSASALIVLVGAVFVSAQSPPPPAAIKQAPPAQVASTNSYGIQLNPSETLLSVNGVPVNQAPAFQPGVQVRAPGVRVNVPSSGCPTCAPGSNFQTNVQHVPASGSRQAIAQERANRMARTRRRGHPPGSFNASFEGVGWDSRPNATPPTCVPGRRGGVADTSGPGWVLVGDAIARNSSGAYRVRLWDRSGSTSRPVSSPGIQSAPQPRRRLFGGGLFRRR